MDPLTQHEIDQAVDELYQLARHPGRPAGAWIHALNSAHPDIVAGLISKLGSTGPIGAEFEALRESARAVLDTKLTQLSVQSMESLEQAATRLQKTALYASVIVGIAGVVATIIVAL